MNSQAIYNYLEENYPTASPATIEQVSNLYQVVNDLDNEYQRLLNVLMVAYQMGYNQMLMDNMSNITALNEELEMLLRG